MTKPRYTSAELDARLRFLLGAILGMILLCTAIGILYALIFVTQPIGAQSENDKMFFNVLGSIATFITGTLAGILIGKGGAKDEAAPSGEAPIADLASIIPPMPDNLTDLAKDIVSDIAPAVPAQVVDAVIDNIVEQKKPDGQVPEEQPIDEDWDKKD